MRVQTAVQFCCVMLALAAARLPAQTPDDATFESLRDEVNDLRARVNANPAPPAARVESMLDNKYGPNAPVTTRTGKLEIGGLLQIWDLTRQADDLDIFGGVRGNGSNGSALDNSGYRIRRAELHFDMAVHENIDAYVMLDPAREATSFPGYPDNQGLFKAMPSNPSSVTGYPLSYTPVGRVQSGAGAPNRMLQDAYLYVHDAVPHHDFTVGQFLPPLGEEGTRNDAYLDFPDRAMVTQLNYLRDLGAQIHGSWWDGGRVQYWAGVFDGAGNYFGTAGQFANRADDNNAKDAAGRVLVRPLWNRKNWGSLEVGGSIEYGEHGKDGDNSNDGSAPTSGLDRRRTAAKRREGWFMYKPLGPVHGLWLRGEWGDQFDRTAPYTVNAFDIGSGPFGSQGAPRPFRRQGEYAALGYKLTDSVFAERLSKKGFFNTLLRPVEFAFRYEQFGNIITESLVEPDAQTDVFSTKVYTFGVNYYVIGYTSRVQMYYSVVDNPTNAERGLRNVKNNVAIATYQLMF